MAELFLKQNKLRYKKIENGAVVVVKINAEWAEYSFRSRLARNGYWITMAAIVVPESGKLIFGASACSPEDRLNRTEAAMSALGRARQVATWMIVGKPGWQAHDTMFGRADSAVCTIDVDKLTGNPQAWKDIQAKARLFEYVVARHAEEQAVNKELKRFRQRHPDFVIKRAAIGEPHAMSAV